MSRTADETATILERALQMSGSGRASFLNEACAGDAELRAEIESLLQSHEEAGAFMAGPTCDVAPATEIAEEVGARIGPYKLLQSIGEGGFGRVYMAEQEEPVRRKVALKIIKLGMDTKEVIARFEAERQALALMDHPNIARVLDAGATQTGRPYFVMELVKGISITEYCDRHNLPTKERLSLFIDVCRAVQHAHQKGVIHRDLKPSNVLVTLHDGTPVPKVIDFGIAKATNQRLTEKTLFTQFRQFIGTPEYMSPEQAEMSGLDIDTRSDVYSLGVLLYELLTGTTPFDRQSLVSAGYGEIQRIIREEEPPKPSTRLSTLGDQLDDVARHRQVDPAALQRALRGDLDWIAMKAMEKDRTRRYDTANGLAMDVQRYLDDEPVLASPPSALYRIRKFAHRNRVALIVGSITAAALLLGVTLGAVGFIQAARERVRLEASQQLLELKEQQLRFEQEKQKLVERSGAGGKISLALRPLNNASGDPDQDYLAEGITDALTTDLERIGSLHVASKASALRYRNMPKTLSEMAAELNVDFVLEGDVQRDGGQVRLHLALVHGMSELTIWDDEFSDDLRNILLLQAQVSRTVANEIHLQLTPQEQELFERARPVDPAAHEAYLKGRYALHRQTREGSVAALKYFDRAIERDPTYAPAYAGRADAYVSLEEVYEAPMDTMPQAREAALRALSLDPTLAEAHMSLGLVLFNFDWDWEGARREFERALELNPDLVCAHLAYARYLAAMLRPDEALARLEIALELDPVSMVTNDSYGSVSFNAREYDLAVEYCSRALELDKHYWSTYTWMGLALAELGRFPDAIEAIETARRLDDSPVAAEFLGGVYARAGYPEKARALIVELDRVAKHRWVCPYEVATIYIALGEYDNAFERFEEAYETRSGCIPNMRSDPRLDPVRADPRFIDLLRRTGHLTQ